MNAIVQAFQDMPESVEKTNMALDIFGRRAGMELMPLLNSSNEELEEMRQRAHDLGAVMSDDLVDASVAFGDAQTDLLKAIQGVKNGIGAELLPGLSQVTLAFADIIAGNEGAGEALTEGIEALVSGITEAVPQILDMVGTLVSTVAEIAPDVISALVDGIVDNLPVLIDTALTLVNTLVEAIIDTLPTLLEGIVHGIMDAIPMLMEALPMIIEMGFKMKMNLITGLISALPELIIAAIDIVISLVESNNTPIYLVLQWFDAIEGVNVSSKLLSKRWTTEITLRDKMFLEKLGVTLPF